MLERLIQSHVVRYVIAGVIAFAIELTFLLVIRSTFGFSVEVATGFAFWVGLAASFLLQKIFAFKDYQRTAKAISKQLGAFVVLVLFNYVFTLVIVGAFPGDMIIISRSLALAIVTLWNFFIYKRFIFK